VNFLNHEPFLSGHKKDEEKEKTIRIFCPRETEKGIELTDGRMNGFSGLARAQQQLLHSSCFYPRLPGCQAPRLPGSSLLK